MTKRDELVDTMSAVNFANGNVRMFFVKQNLENLLENNKDATPEMDLSECVSMPLVGFLYAVKIVQDFLQDENMQRVIKKYQEAGLLPTENPTNMDEVVAETVESS